MCADLFQICFGKWHSRARKKISVQNWKNETSKLKASKKCGLFCQNETCFSFLLLLFSYGEKVMTKPDTLDSSFGSKLRQNWTDFILLSIHVTYYCAYILMFGFLLFFFSLLICCLSHSTCIVIWEGIWFLLDIDKRLDLLNAYWNHPKIWQMNTNQFTPTNLSKQINLRDSKQEPSPMNLWGGMWKFRTETAGNFSACSLSLKYLHFRISWIQRSINYASSNSSWEGSD